MSGFNCCFFIHIQVSQKTGKVVWYTHLFKNFPQFVVIHTVRGFSIVNEAEEHVFLEYSCFFSYPVDVGNLISGSSAFSKPSLYVFKFLVHVMLKFSLKDFEYNLTGMQNESNFTVVCTFFGTAFFVIRMKTDLFQSCGHCWVLQICWHWVKHSNSLIFQDFK